MDIDSQSERPLVRTFTDRVGLVVFAIVLFCIGAWMWWIVQKFADGNTWWDFSVKLVLDELIFAIALLGLALIVHALFPKATLKFLVHSAQKLTMIVTLLLSIIVLTFVFVSLILPVLLHFRILK